MRIISITAQKPNSTGSGIYLTELVKQFNKMGHEQVVIAGVDVQDKVPVFENVGFHPVYFNTKELPFNVVGMSDNMPYPSTRYNQLTNAMAIQMEQAFLEIIKQVITDFKPDLIICHHLYFLTAIVREHFPCLKMIGICHGSDIRQFIKTDLQRIRIKNNIAKLNWVCALHAIQRQEIAKLYQLSQDKIRILGTGYDQEIFSNRHYPKEKVPVKIIFAGKIAYAKGVCSLLKGLSRIDGKTEFELYLAGGYSDENEYREILSIGNTMPFNVKWLGKLSQAELASYFNQCHVMVLPSFFEGLPLVLIEALACGLKVVSTDLPGIKQWVDSNIPQNNIRYIKQPKMLSVDEPCPDALEDFELEIAHVIQEVMKDDTADAVCLKNATWENVCARVLEEIE